MTGDSFPNAFNLSGWIGGAAAVAGVDGGGGGTTVEPSCFNRSGCIPGAGDAAIGVLGTGP